CASGPHPSPPSVPTRRSSDLEEPVVEPEVDEDDEIDPDAPVVEDGIDDRVPFHGVLAPLGALSGDRRRLSAEEGAITWRDGAAPDRKSTRLNSSHVKISYAVF